MNAWLGRARLGAARHGEAWLQTKSYLLSRNPADRTMRGLALRQADAGDFHWQTSAIYNAVTALLAGLDEQDDV